MSAVDLFLDCVQVPRGVHSAIGPFGKFWRSRPLVFSFEPRCQGERESQKFTRVLCVLAASGDGVRPGKVV